MSNTFNDVSNLSQRFRQLMTDDTTLQHQQKQYQQQPDGRYIQMTEQQMQNSQMQQQPMQQMNPYQQPHHGYPGVNPNGYPPNNQPHPGITPWQGMDSFRKLEEEFNKTRDELRKTYESKEIVNDDALMAATNYTMLQKWSDDNDLNNLYFSNPDYVCRLFERTLSSNGMWLDNAFAIMNSDNVLTITTPGLTLRVTMISMTLVYEGSKNNPLNKTQVLKGLVPILKFIEKVYTDDEECKRQEEIERIKSLASDAVGDDDSDDTESYSDSDEDSEQMCSSSPIRLHTRKIKNPRANFSKFIKKVSDSAPNAKRYLGVNANGLINMIKRVKQTAENEDIFKIEYQPRVTERGIHVIDSSRIIINIDGLYLDLSEMPHEPLIKHFEYAKLDDPRIIAATIELCRVLDTLIGSN